ncbi:MAG: hypothetical protein FDW93_01835 [Bergeyella sp.]|nr:hypothetical protein [Bergeyella sp.]
MGQTHNSNIYAYRKVALWSSKQEVSKGLGVLLNPEVKKNVIVNLSLSPYGKNSVFALKKVGIYLKVERKLDGRGIY